MSQGGPQRQCVQEKSTAVVIYWAAKSHKMSLTTLFHSYQSVSYFSLNPPVTCRSFPIPGESKFPLAWKRLQSFFFFFFISSTNFQWTRQWEGTGRDFSTADVEASTALQFFGPAVPETISRLLLRRQRYLVCTTTVFHCYFHVLLFRIYLQYSSCLC